MLRRLVKVQVAIAVIAVAVTVVVAVQIGPLIETKAQLESEIASKKSQIEELRVEEETLRENISKLVKVLNKRDSIEITPNARADIVGGLKDATGHQIYDFALWISVPEELGPEIERVEYEFDHPSFRSKTQISREPANGFRVGYRGWGCLALITIHVFLRDGTSYTMYFDMCEALDW